MCKYIKKNPMQMIRSMEVTRDVKILIAVLIASVVFGASVIGWLTWNDTRDKQTSISTTEQAASRMERRGMVVAGPNDSAAAGAPVAKSVMLDEVTQHKSPDDCQTIIRGGVYDIAPFIRQHPDGKMNFENTCGVDSTQLFEGQYGGFSKEEEQLKGLFVGVFMKQ